MPKLPPMNECKRGHYQQQMKSGIACKLHDYPMPDYSVIRKEFPFFVPKPEISFHARLLTASNFKTVLAAEVNLQKPARGMSPWFRWFNGATRTGLSLG